MESGGRLERGRGCSKSYYRSSDCCRCHLQSRFCQESTLDQNGQAIGAEVGEEERLLAMKTVLATGVYTAKILANSAPERKELQADGRLTAAAAAMCLFRVLKAETGKFGGASIVVASKGDFPVKRSC